MRSDQEAIAAFSALNPRQAIFVREYVKGCSGVDAAKEAGYAQSATQEKRDATLRMTASRLLKNPAIEDAIKCLQSEINERCIVDVDWWIHESKKIYEQCWCQTDAKGEPKFDSAGAIKALDMIGKYLGVYKTKEEKGEVNESLTAILESLDGKCTGRPNKQLHCNHTN